MKQNVNYGEDIVKEIQKDYYARREMRKPLELQWRLNMNFFNGNQYSEISPIGEIEQYGKQYFWQEREVYNHIASIVETRLSKLARTKTSVAVRPMSNDDSDLNAAKLSSLIVKAVCEENNIAQLLNSATTWSEVCGTCFVKVVWNGDKGNRVGENKQGKALYEGDVEMAIAPPFEIFPDNICVSNIDECRSIIHAKAYHVDEIKDIWGVSVNGQDVNVFSLDNAATCGGLGYQASAPNIIDNVSPDNCIVIERYTRPSSTLPNGELVIVAGDKLLYRGDLPYVIGANGERDLPFVKIHCIDKVGCFFGTSIIERMIPLQRAYNAVKNRKHEFLNRIAMGVLAVEDGSVDIENLEDEGLSPGKVLVYRQGTKPPTLLDSGNVPFDFTREEERLLSEFITISGVSELSKYSQTYSSMSGKAISLLVEQDDTRLSIASSSIRLGVKKISEFVLRLYKQFAMNKRLKKIGGDNGVVERVFFSSNDLQSEDIVFEEENELSDTLASRRNMAMELIKMGALVDENGKMSNRNKTKLLELLGFGNWENARDIDDCQRKNAIKEVLEMDTKKLEVEDIDDHKLHVEEHTKALLTNDEWEIDRKNKLKEHIKQHKLMMTIAEGAEENGTN
ncbi:MAG: hypothetical protein RSB61_03970 [Clostridia bacterium]